MGRHCKGHLHFPAFIKFLKKALFEKKTHQRDHDKKRLRIFSAFCEIRHNADAFGDKRLFALDDLRK